MAILPCRGREWLFILIQEGRFISRTLYTLIMNRLSADSRAVDNKDGFVISERLADKECCCLEGGFGDNERASR